MKSKYEFFIFNEEEKVTATALKKIIKNTSFTINFFRETPKITSDNLLFLGHSSEITTQTLFNTTTHQTINGLSAKQFASALAIKCKNRETDIKNIYLISCEAGYIKKTSGDCLAQDIADELWMKGFKNVTIHAMTKPIDTPDEGMRISIISKPGAFALSGSAIGDIKSYASDTESTNSKSMLPFNSIPAERLLEEWNRPHNTFSPQKTTQKQPRPQKFTQQEQLIFKIDQTIKIPMEKNKANKKYLEKITALRNELANLSANSDTDYHEIITQKVQRQTKNTWLSVIKSDSPYLSLLKKIQQDLASTHNPLQQTKEIPQKEKTTTSTNTTAKHVFKTHAHTLFKNLNILSIDAMTLEIQQRQRQVTLTKTLYQTNQAVIDFIENNEFIKKLQEKSTELAATNPEAELKAHCIDYLLMEIKLLNSINEVETYLTNIQSKETSDGQNEPAFYKEALNRPLGWFRKFLQFCGFEIQTETGYYLNELLQTVRTEIEETAKNAVNVI